MGSGRFAYGMWGQRLSLERLLIACSASAAVCYVVASTVAVPAISLLACALCGLSVSLLWPGTFSLTSARFLLGGAAMFALLALAGDAGATVGPWLAGVLASATDGWLAPLVDLLPADGGSGLRVALLLSAVVPVIFTATVLRVRRARSVEPVPTLLV